MLWGHKMKETALLFLNNFWILLNSIAVFILIGVLIAGVFKLLIPDSFIKKHLGQHNFMANIKAAILGIPLPLCSCSVIPFVSALKKSGASRSAIQTFLIATPITGADSILATYGVFGWVFTLYRVVTSIIIALVAGLFTLFLVKEQPEDQPEAKKSRVAKPLNINVVVDDGSPAKNTMFEMAKKIVSYAFDDIYKDIARSLMIGIVLGALIVTFMPADMSSHLSENPWLNYVLVLLISAPLYVCATASIPLGLSLITAGFSPGAAFILLTAGPATNTITMSVVLKTLGKMSLVIYLASVIIGSIAFGFFFDTFFASTLNQIMIIGEHEEDIGFMSQVTSVILLYLSLMYIFNKNAKIIDSGGCSGGCASSCGS